MMLPALILCNPCILVLLAIALSTKMVQSDVLSVPSQYASIGAAFTAVQTGDIILLSSGTYSGNTNCGLHLEVNNVTLAGSTAPNAPSIIACNSSLYIPLVLGTSSTTIATSVTIRDLVFENIGPRTHGAGIIYATVSSFIMSNCQLLNGVLQGVPPAIPFTRQNFNGGAVLINPKVAPVTIVLTDVAFVNNVVSCTDSQVCQGAAVGIAIESSVVTDPGVITASRCRFTSNYVEATGNAIGMQGSGLQIVNLGTAPFNVNIESSIFSGNSMINHNTDALGVLATGGGFNLVNIDFTTSGQMAIFNVNITNSSFIDNVVVDNGCGGFNNTANGAGVAVFSANNIIISESTFQGNIATGNGLINQGSADLICISEGGALFIQGLPLLSTPSADQPIVKISQSKFTDNVANCSGAGCIALGGGITIVTAYSITFDNILALGNVATCMGMSCNVQGGFLQVQNGCGAGNLNSCGKVNDMPLDILDSVIDSNSVMALPPGNFITPFDGPQVAIFGGGIAATAFAGGTSIYSSNVLYRNNIASCAYQGCTIFGSHFGQFQYPETKLNSSFFNSQFECGDVSCSVIGCNADNTSWSASTLTPLYISGSECSIDCDSLDTCSFIGTAPPVGKDVHISIYCNVTNAFDGSTCSATDDGNDNNNDDDHQSSPNSSSKETSFTPVDIIIGAAIGGTLVVSGIVFAIWRYYWQPNQRRKDTGLLNAQHDMYVI